jgi:membrane protein YdbS with pleckstrin-like domain
LKKNFFKSPVLDSEILISGEEIITESHPVIWPHLVEPGIVAIISATLAGVFFYLEPKFPDFPLWKLAEWIVLAIMIISLLSIFLRWLQLRYTIYALTNKRILHRTGVFARSYVDCSLGKVQNVEVKMSALSRTLGFGTIRIATARTKGDDIAWVNVKDPIGLQKQINENLEKFIKQ